MNVRQEGSCAHPQLPDVPHTPHLKARSTALPREPALTVLILLLTAALLQAIRKFFFRFILGMAWLQQRLLSSDTGTKDITSEGVACAFWGQKTPKPTRQHEIMWAGE